MLVSCSNLHQQPGQVRVLPPFSGISGPLSYLPEVILWSGSHLEIATQFTTFHVCQQVRVPIYADLAPLWLSEEMGDKRLVQGISLGSSPSLFMPELIVQLSYPPGKPHAMGWWQVTLCPAE